jgi:hypothetical protein
MLGLVQPQEAAASAGQSGATYVILADELRRARVERLIGDLAAQGVRYSPDESGLYYVSCVTAWRNNPIQAEDCIRSRLPQRRGVPLVVLNTHHREARQDVTIIICIGRGGSGRAVLRQRVSSEDVVALRRCFDDALRDSYAPAFGWYNIRHTREFEFQDVAAARERAASVLRIAVDHVGVPRGSTGSCLIQGRVAGVVKGVGLSPRRRFAVGVPCGSLLSRGTRRLHMGDLREGRFANVYLSDENTLLDYQPLPSPEAGLKGKKDRAFATPRDPRLPRERRAR